MDESVESESNHTSPLMDEIEYGPALVDRTKMSFRQKLEEQYERLGCWTITTMLFSSPFVFIYLFFKPPMWIFNVAYILWMIYDRETPHRGSRRVKWLRKIRFWRGRRDYFPCKLVKTAEIPPNTTYLFASFPHGFLCYGPSTNIMSDVNQFDEAFPGLNPYLATLNGNYYAPFMRDFYLLWGGCAVSPRSISHILNGPAGNVCVLIVGGRSEQKINTPGKNRVVLKNRKGFVRMALKSGSSLVPVYSFGETFLYKEPTSNLYRRLREKLRASFDPEFFLFRGPCTLGHLFGLLPYQQQVTTVVGKPIPVPKVEEPTKELIDKYHEIFVQEFVQLFEKYKGKYDPEGEEGTLRIE
ncbi:2-acylglycerol O-acyltransferase 3-like [Planococcus citri]|uniref:2-acylglycerol O-acyltransferase 3-like n=1 Tax=Planococcus citri TaxID=170843 RepID=UPI0031F9ED0B